MARRREMHNSAAEKRNSAAEKRNSETRDHQVASCASLFMEASLLQPPPGWTRYRPIAQWLPNERLGYFITEPYAKSGEVARHQCPGP
jgi:hypothetical protein